MGEKTIRTLNNDKPDSKEIFWEISSRLFVRRLVHGVLLYGLVKLKSLVTLPFYASVLHPEGLGTFSLIGITVSLLWPLFALNLHTGSATYLIHARNNAELRRGYYSALNFAFLTTAAGCFLLFLVQKHGIPSFISPYFYLIVVYIMLSLLKEFAIALPQIFQRTATVLAAQLAIEYGGAVLSILLIYLGGGIEGALVGVLIPIGIVTILLHLGHFTRLGYYPGVDFKELKRYLLFGLPLLIVSLSQWMVLAADNYFLLHRSGTAAVGIYTAAYSISSVVLLGVSVVNLVWYPTLVKTLEQDAAGFAQIITAKIRWLTVVFLAAMPLYFSASVWAVRVLLGRDFTSSGVIAPFIALAYALFVISQFFQGLLVLRKKAAEIMICYLVGALLNLGLNFLLIPPLGIYGATLATVVSYATIFFLLLLAATRIFTEIRVGKFFSGCFAVLAAVGLTVWGGGKFLESSSPFGACALSFLALGLYVVLSVMLKLISPAELKRVWDLGRSAIGVGGRPS